MKITRLLSLLFPTMIICFSCDSQVNERNLAYSINTFASEEVDTTDSTNGFYDNEDTYSLDTCEIEVLGEIINAWNN